MEHIGKILPVHGYRVSLTTSLPVDYIQSLIHLYQPLIGRDAVSLYLTLLQDKEVQTDEAIFTHHLLMNQLSASLPTIYKARTKLEAIGLMKTYEQEEEQMLVFSYLLQPPFRPQYFFQDMMLSELLYREIGQTKFNVLKEHYDQSEKAFAGTDISANFHDVFQTVSTTGKPMPPQTTYTEENSFMPEDKVDFTPLIQSLEKHMIDAKKVLTPVNKRYIIQLMTLYNLAFYELEKALQWALTEENTLDIEQLKQACHDLFQQKHQTAYPKMEPKIPEKVDFSPAENRDKQVSSDTGDTVSKEDQLVQKLETISPYELLRDLSLGEEAPIDDIKMIRDIMTSTGLSAPVMNVIIHYVLLQSNMQLPKAYVSKIAGHWSRLGFKTAKEAMDFARSEVEKRKDNKAKQTSNRSYYKSKNKEIIPDWFKEKQEEQQKKQDKKKDVSSKTEDTTADDKEREAMLALLHQHANK